MINIRLKPEEFPFKVIKRLLIWFVTPEVWQNMLNAKMQLAPHYSHQRHVPLPCCLSTPHSTATLQTCQMKTFTNYVQPSQLQRLIMSVSLPPIFHTEVFAPHGTIEHKACSIWDLKQTDDNNRKGTRTVHIRYLNIVYVTNTFCGVHKLKNARELGFIKAHSSILNVL